MVGMPNLRTRFQREPNSPEVRYSVKIYAFRQLVCVRSLVTYINDLSVVESCITFDVFDLCNAYDVFDLLSVFADFARYSMKCARNLATVSRSVANPRVLFHHLLRDWIGCSTRCVSVILTEGVH